MMKKTGLPVYPYGAVYFRKSNPPKEDWERDYQKAAEDGMNAFRHWFMWGVIEVASGKFDWDDYDQQFDLAAKYGIKTVIAELIHLAPEWAFHEFAHARYLNSEGKKIGSNMRNSSVTGGSPGLCYDNEDAKEAAGNFLTELVNRYKNHPAMGWYDLWNETNLFSSSFMYCYCPATIERFRDWLKEKYGDVRTLGEAWQRYSYSDWEQVLPPQVIDPPRRRRGAYPDQMDWVGFRIDNAFRLFQWRVDLVRELDPINVVTAHGVDDSSIHRMVDAADDVWRAAKPLDGYGYGGGSASLDRFRDRWKRWISPDVTRSGAGGKPFWAAEMSAGPIWTSARNGNPRETGRIPQGEDVRLTNLIAMAGGVKGIFSNRWRPLLDGPLFGGMGYYDMDGSSTPRSEMAAKIAKWANAPEQEKLWKSSPVAGDIGIVAAPESQVYVTLWQESSDFYANSARGAYRAFLDNNIQADWVRIHQIDNYELLYLPSPIMLEEGTARALASWVERGGCLISEGCPAYFSDHGRAGVVQPNLGLDKVFGATQDYVEFVPDLLENETFSVDGNNGIYGGVYRQAYKLAGGVAAGHYADGRIAVVDNAYGQGKTRLIGTLSGIGYWQHYSQESKNFYAGIPSWADKEQHVKPNEDLVTARLHTGEGGTYLWVINNRADCPVTTLLVSNNWGPFSDCEVLWGERKPTIKGREITVTIPPFDALLVKLV